MAGVYKHFCPLAHMDKALEALLSIAVMAHFLQTLLNRHAGMPPQHAAGF
jgi:hypothetical protein